MSQKLKRMMEYRRMYTHVDVAIVEIYGFEICTAKDAIIERSAPFDINYIVDVLK